MGLRRHQPQRSIYEKSFFNPIRNSVIYLKIWSATRRKRLRCASDSLTLGTLAHFRHF
jgi:hypothetical protein